MRVKVKGEHQDGTIPRERWQRSPITH